MADGQHSFPTASLHIAPDGKKEKHENELDWYMALCLGGLQAIVKTEVVREIRARGWRAEVQCFQEDCEGAQSMVGGVHNGQAGCGKLLVGTNAPPAVLKGLRCVQAFFALIAHATSLDIVLPNEPLPPVDSALPATHESASETRRDALPTASDDLTPSRIALARVESLVTSSTLWPAALQIWKRFKDSDVCVSSPIIGSSSEVEGKGVKDRSHPNREVDLQALKFRASVVRDGRHPFNSVEASPRLGSAVWAVNRGWTVSLKEYDVEVLILILERGAIVGLSLASDRSKRSSNGRVPKEDKGFIEIGKRMSSLRPSTAHLMLGLAAPKSGDVVVDCMCGVGTIPFLGAEWLPDVFFVGGEIDETAMEHVKHNAQSSRRSASGMLRRGVGASACAWDAQALPLRDGAVDAMVVDMPFGHSCGTPRVIEKLYPVVMAELARVVRPGSGRAVLLVAQPHHLGLPGIRRERKKDRAHRPLQGGHGSDGGLHVHGVRKEVSHSQQPKGHGGKWLGKHAEDTKCGGTRDCEVDTGEGQRALKSKGSMHDDSLRPVGRPAPQGITADTHQSASNTDAVAESPSALWRVRTRHAVNVGGLISWLVILDRTTEPAPAPRFERRKRWVGLHAYSRRRNDEARDSRQAATKRR